MENKLIKQLNKVIDSTQLPEVKQVIVALSKINDFKHSISSSSNLSIIYKKINQFVLEEFKIEDLKIIQTINNTEYIKYQVGIDGDYLDSYSKHTNSGMAINILFNYKNLTDFDKLFLDTCLDEITNILYVQFVLLELQDVSHIDDVTQLKTIDSFYEDMKALIPLALRENMKIGVLLINIDEFTILNQEQGTKVGDKFLLMYANIIKEMIRDSDIVIRYGGGEFLVLLMNIIDDDKTLEMAKKLQKRLSSIHVLVPKQTVSIGISMFPEDSKNIKKVIKYAKDALEKNNKREKIFKYIKSTGLFSLFS